MLKHYDIRITGLDLKQKVIEDCQALADRYGYDGLQFLCGDIADYNGTDEVDMVVTLHACDTATDYALYKAVKWHASVILSVPCCQHELNRKMQCETLSGAFQYGLIKERTAALMTDAMRGQLLEMQGYKTQLLEFIDMEHTPKNILIRGVKSRGLLPKARQKAADGELSEVQRFLWCRADPGETF
ncbi:MAG: class I SAM-dependent methyltransferase [Coprococcus sp.]